MKRFYSAVSIVSAHQGWQVALDGRGIRTVGGAQQIVASEALAHALASEWDVDGQTLDPKAFPLRDLADYAIDRVAPDPARVAGKLVNYGETDTLCYRANPDEPLFERQQAVWEPVLQAFERREQLEMVRVSGIVHRPQAKDALARMRARIEREDCFRLAALEAMTALSASLVIGLSALAEDTGEEDAARALWQAASLEEEWQADLWGRDAEAEARRRRREADFLRAWRFARAAAGGG